MSITTKTREDSVSQIYTFDYSGSVLSEKPSHLGQGTTISASNLFKNVPVRRQFFNNVKKKKEELKKVEELLMTYGVVRPDVRIVLKHNKDVLWQKAVMADAKAVLKSIFGRNTVSKMVEKTSKLDDSKGSVQAFLPKKGSEMSSTSRSTNDRCWLAVNKRPVQLKDIEKVVKQHYCHGNQCENRYPMCFIHITVPSSDIDVNVDPNKTRVMLHQHSSVIQLLCLILGELYGPLEKSDQAEITDLDNTNDSMLSDSCSDNSFVDSFDPKMYYGNQKERCTSESSKVTSVAFRASKVVSMETASKEFVKPSNKIVASGFYKNCDDNNVVSVEEFKCSNNTNEAVENDDSASGNNVDVIESDFGLLKDVIFERKDSDDELVVSNNGTEGINTNEKELAVVSQLDKGKFDIIDDDLEDLFDTPVKDNFRATLDDTEDPAIGPDETFADLLKNTSRVVNTESDSRTSYEKTDATSIEKIENCSKDDLNSTDEILALLEDNEDGIGDGLIVNERTEASSEEVAGVDKRDYTNKLDWSKGVSENQTDGVTIQPVKVLTSGSNSGSLSKKRPSSPGLDVIGTPPAKRRSTDTQINQPKLYDMVGRSPADKISVGFLAFSQEFRPEVVEDNPTVNHDEITTIVRRKWEVLADDEKERYDEAGRKHVATLKKKAAKKKQDTSMQKVDNRLQKVAGLPSIKDQLIAGRKKLDVSNTKPIKSVKVSFCMKSLQTLYQSGLRQTQTQKTTSQELIGPLKFYNGWLCRHGNKIQVINPHRVEETLLHKELMENHIIPAAKLENTVGLNASSIGDAKLYEKLLEMVPSNTCQTFVYIEDRRLKANGIEICCHLDQNSRPVLELVGLANCMPMYGVKDLQEILNLIANSGAKTVAQSRPLKVQFYLQGEAVRMIRQRPVHRSREDLMELFDQMEDNLPVDCVTCLHNKHFIQTLYDLNDIPVSQNM